MSIHQSGDQAKFIAQGTFNNVAGDQYNQNFIQDSDPRSTESILRRLRPANMDASHRTGCLPGTRTTWTQLIMNWALDPSEKRNVLWIYGLAGSGKSTLATEVADQLLKKGHLGAFIFFERDVIDRSEPLVVIRTIAFELGLNQAQLREAICAVVERQPNTAHFPLESQFRQLLVESLPAPSSAPPTQARQSSSPVQTPSPHVPKSSFRRTLSEKLSATMHKATESSSATMQHHVIVIVLDALDECGTPEKRKSLVRILSELTREIPYLRFIITSRPERDIRGAFEHQSHVLSRELDTSSHDTTHDISTYLTIRINEIKLKSLDLREQPDWPGDEAVQLLVRRASGLFIWATTAARFIDAYNPKVRLRLILQDSSQGDVGRKLDVLYQTTLESAGDWEDTNFVQDFRSIMAIVLVATYPLSAKAIDQLRKRSDNQQSCTHFISHLGCLLQQKPVVRLLHPSFADFLFTRSRCDREYWFLDQTELHHNLAASCIDRLNTSLKTNIRNLVLSPDPVDEGLPEDLEYACLYWVEHICRLNSANSHIVELLRDFLMEHLLHWIEAMSILKMTRDAIVLLQRLSTWLSNLAAVEIKLFELVNDGVRFVQRYPDLIEDHPLHVYASALPFTPPDTMLYKMFHDPLCHPVLWGPVERSWSPLLQELSLGRGNTMESVACSPDGTRIVSGSVSIRVWDATSGIEILPELTGHNGTISSVVFSPDGTRIASGSRDLTIRLWDASSGVEVLRPMLGHTGIVASVVFSHDGKLIISGSYDKNIRVWDANSGVEVLHPLQGHTGKIHSVACSQTRIASGSSDKTIRVWDIASGLEAMSPLKGHTGSINSIAFSADGRHIASGSDDCTIHLWDSNTGAQILPPFQGHSSTVESVAFSPDGTRIVSASFMSEKAIRVWDSTTGTEVIPPLFYTNPFGSVSFSPDGTRIISGTGGAGVQIWDANSTPKPISSPEGHTLPVSTVAFSQDGARLVTGSEDRTVCIWDTASGVQLLPPMKGPIDRVFSVAFSPDGTQIVSGCGHGTVCTWDAITGKILSNFPTHRDSIILAVTFSPDGKQIAAGSLSGTVHVWNATTGLAVLPPLEQRQSVKSVAFSSDGFHVVSHHSNGYYTWDVVSGTRISKNEDAGPMPTGGDLEVDSRSRWITDRLTKNYLCKIPSSFNLTTMYGVRYAVHGRTLVVGTRTGKISIMRFPTSS